MERIPVSIEDKLKISNLEGYDLSCLDNYMVNGRNVGEQVKGMLIGNMVQVDFAKTLTEHIRINILRQ